MRPYRPSDWSGVLSVLAACYGESATRDQIYEAWNLKCQVAKSGFMVADVGGQVVGAQPMLIHDWRREGATIRGGVLTGVVVHPGFRRQGLFTKLVQACLDEAWSQDAAFVLTMPNEKSWPGFLRMGWTDLGERSVLARARFARPRRHTEVEISEDATAEVTALGPSHMEAFQGLAVLRSSDWWRWRFGGRSPRRYVHVVARDSQGRAEAVAAGTIRSSRGLSVGYVVDFLAVSREALAKVCTELATTLMHAGALGVVSVVSHAGVEEALRMGGFFRVSRSLPIKRFRTVACVRPGGPSTIPGFKNLAAWNLTLGDWDNI